MTQLNFLNDTYCFESTAQYIEIRKDENGVAILLESTIFYPQGGGQPSDTGVISSENARFEVTHVYLDQDGLVWHYGNFTQGSFTPGETTNLVIDSKKRELHARLHSAGHLISNAVEELHISELVPTKGFHFPEGTYLEFRGVAEDKEKLMTDLQKKLDLLVGKSIPVVIENLSPEEASAKNISSPPNKSVRVMNFEGFSVCGCGGTHVNNTSQLGRVIVRKIRQKKGITKISYSVE